METIADIRIKKINESRIHEVDFDNLEFARHISDHMLVCDYDRGWKDAEIIPFDEIKISPAAMALHYGQTVFEGMKAFRMEDGSVNLFRLDRHYERFARSLERMCMAVVPYDIFVEGLKSLMQLDYKWIPVKEGDALYLRPFAFATESRFGVKVSEEYRFMIITGPVPTLYSEPIRVKVETEFIRAARGGTGYAKCGGNYGGAYYPTQLARKEGYHQVLWTDARDHAFIEESGTMNAMFVINGTLVTPPLSDSILDGITRDSLLRIAEHMGIETRERPVSIAELEESFKNKTITEAFGAGTAAVVAPMSVIGINGINYTLHEYGDESVCMKLKKKLERIRIGKDEDVFNWNVRVDYTN